MAIFNKGVGQRVARSAIRIDLRRRKIVCTMFKYLHGDGVVPSMASLFMRVRRVRFGRLGSDPSYCASANHGHPLKSVPRA